MKPIYDKPLKIFGKHFKLTIWHVLIAIIFLPITIAALILYGIYLLIVTIIESIKKK